MSGRGDDGLAWLMQWYAAQCDENWEHSFGVSIETLDNPGWTLRIDLEGTALAGKAFETVDFNMEAADGDPTANWHHCKVEDAQFRAVGGAHDLGTLIGVFRRWADEYPA